MREITEYLENKFMVWKTILISRIDGENWIMAKQAIDELSIIERLLQLAIKEEASND